MTSTIAILMNVAFAAVLVSVWALVMAGARHLREERAQEHVLPFTSRHDVQARGGAPPQSRRKSQGRPPRPLAFESHRGRPPAAVARSFSRCYSLRLSGTSHTWPMTLHGAHRRSCS